MKKIANYNKKLDYLILILLLVLSVTYKAAGQKETPLNSKFQGIAKPESTKGWIYFFENYKANPATIFIDLKDAFELSDNDQMMLKKTEKDDIGFTHYRYQQYYKNYRVLYGEYIVHQQSDGFVTSANGRLITGLKLNNSVAITEKEALETALKFMSAAKYLWQNNAMEKELKRQQKNENATYYPKGEMVYAPDENNENFNALGYHLTWCFKIYPDGGSVKAKNVYVDVLTDKVIYQTDIAINCSTGSGTSTYNGTVAISTQFTLGFYYSHNDCQPANIFVYNCNRGQTSTTLYSDNDNSWTAASQQSAVQAQWGAAETYDYYNIVHTRQSWDGQSGDMVAYNNAVYGNPLTATNACWNCIAAAAIFGAGNTTAANDDWNTDDIMGHEFTHGVTQSSAQLDYKSESGALNESFSDIFGEMVESWAEGNCDYLVGADKSDGAIRSFIDPSSYSDNFGPMPDTYLGNGWYFGTGDNGGVHHNSSVQNHWFYLLSEGGNGTNDKGESYNVTGITRFKARLIAYRALTLYLTSSSQYIDARRASLQAAIYLYGSCSQEAISVGDAWHAVGVESQSPAYTINACGSYPASGTFVQAISTLTAANGCTTTITPGSSTVYFSARDTVILYPGFTATNGSNFVAYLEPCSSTNWLTAPKIIMSDAEKGLKTQVAYQPSTLKESLITNELISVTPNPFTSSFTIAVNSKQNEKVQVIIYSSVGAKVKERTGISLSKGFNKISFDGSNLSRGVYMLEVNFGDSKSVKKIVRM